MKNQLPLNIVHASCNTLILQYAYGMFIWAWMISLINSRPCINVYVWVLSWYFVCFIYNNNQSCSPLGLCGALWGPDDRGWCGGGCYCWNLRGQNQAIWGSCEGLLRICSNIWSSLFSGTISNTVLIILH